MTEAQTPPPAPPAQPGDNERTVALICYVLQAVSVVTAGLIAVIAVIIAYLRKDQAPDWLQNHYTYQIRTFWYGLVAWLVGILTIWVLGLGLLIMLATAIWFIVRSVVGLIRLSEGRTHADPTGFWV
ncbi:MAG: DUF4870 family protein [Glycocaulis sp.]